MKIVCLLGSPRRNGNTARIAERFLEKGKEKGAEVTTHFLNGMNYRGCQACYACKKGSETCVVKDDLTQVLKDVQEADVVVLASPVYYGDITGQLKNFFDRTYCYLKPEYLTDPKAVRLAPGKRLLFVTTQGHPDASLFGDIFPRYDFFFKWYGFEKTECVRGCGLSAPDDVEQRPELLAAAEKAADALL